MPTESIYSASSSSTDNPGSLPCAAASTSSPQPEELVDEVLDPTFYLRLQELLAQMPVAMYLLRGPAHVLELVNRPAAAGWGCSPDQVQGQPFFDALPSLRGQGYEAAYATVWQTQQVVAWREAPIMGGEQPGGRPVPSYLNVCFQPFYEVPGLMTGILVTSHDATEQVLARQRMHHTTAELSATNAGLADYVTELTHSAQAAQVYAESQTTLLAQLLEQLPLAIGLFVGADYVVEFCNPSLLALWECSLAQVLHQPLLEVVPALQRQRFQELLGEVGGPNAAAVAHQLPGPGGTAFSFIFHPLYGTQGQRIAIAVVAASAPGPVR